MNTYIEKINEIKTKLNKDWLTVSQKRIFNQCKEFLESHNKLINLYGKEGIGKTFIGWVLNKEKIGKYYSTVNEIEENQRSIIIDNCDYNRQFARNLRNKLRLKKINHALLITRYRVEDDIPAFCLNITEDDIKIFKHNLFVYLDMKVSDIIEKNLWEYFKRLGE